MLNWLLIILLTALVTVFAALNSQNIELNYILGSKSIYLPLLLVGTLLLGILIGYLLNLKVYLKSKIGKIHLKDKEPSHRQMKEL